jgi:hypothetical protein
MLKAALTTTVRKAMPKITYYASVTPAHGRSNPVGLLRRIHTQPEPTDEVFRRDLQWHPTEALYRYWLGHNDNDYVEITEEEANNIIARWRERFQPSG